MFTGVAACPLQSRCAILRFTKLTNEQILRRLLVVCQKEKVSCVALHSHASCDCGNNFVPPTLQVNYTDAGLEAILFTAEGDMRTALNSLQATHAGFGRVDDANVYKVRP